MTREGPFWDVMEGRVAPPPAAVLLGWELVAVDPAAGVIQGGFLAAMLDDTLGPALACGDRRRDRGHQDLPPMRTGRYQRSRCTTSPNGRRRGLRTGISGRSAG